MPNTENTRAPVCPYCGQVHEDVLIDLDAADMLTEMPCGVCGRTFTLEMDRAPRFSTRRPPAPPPPPIPDFEWPKCPQCEREVGIVAQTMGGKAVARCGNCDDRDGYATADDALTALRNYAARKVCD